MAEIRVEIEGTARLKRNLARAGAKGTVALRRGLRLEGEKIMAASKRLVPVETGNLRASGRVRQSRGRRQEVGNVDLVYGGPSAPYAVFVHEIPPPGGGGGDLQPARPTKRRARHHVGQWKFLEAPARARAKVMARSLANEVERELRSLGRGGE